MTENRVRVRDYGCLASSDPRLIPIASVPGKTCKLHHLAAAAFANLSLACVIQTGIKLAAASGWRPHRWRDRADYENYLIETYSDRLRDQTANMTPERARAHIIQYGRRWVAYDSPHETGLAVDLGCGGLSPDSATAQRQKLTTLYHWLTDHAAAYGWTPYLPEPWHWEFNVPKAEWERLP